MSKLHSHIVDAALGLLMQHADVRTRIVSGTTLILSILPEIHAGVLHFAPQMQDRWQAEFPACNALMAGLTKAEPEDGIATRAAHELMLAMAENRLQDFCRDLKAALPETAPKFVAPEV